MLLRLHLILAALAMLVAPLAMQSGMVMAMPVNHHEMSQAGHCGDVDSKEEDKPDMMTQCCVATCSVVAPVGTAAIDAIAYHAPLLFGMRAIEHRPFLAKLPTPPPRTS